MTTTTAPAARLKAFHASRANAAASAVRHAQANGLTSEAMAWEGVLRLHRIAAETGDAKASDRAEAAHEEANRRAGTKA